MRRQIGRSFTAPRCAAAGLVFAIWPVGLQFVFAWMFAVAAIVLGTGRLRHADAAATPREKQSARASVLLGLIAIDLCLAWLWVAVTLASAPGD